MSYNRELSTAIEAAVIAGNEIEKGFLDYHNQRERFALERKKNLDSSSEDDKIQEKRIRGVLRANFHNYSIFGEEEGRSEAKSRYEWVVDPTDGTTQKALHVPYFCVSIGLYDHETSKVIVGVLYNPITHEMYRAVRGEGAFYEVVGTSNKHKLKTSDSTDFKHLIALANENKDAPECFEPMRKIEKLLGENFRIQPRTYSTALDLTRVADGLAGLAIAPRTAPYDHAAGSLIVEEAGGIVVGPENTGFDAMNRGIIAVGNESTLVKLGDIGVFDILRKIS